MPMTWIAPLLLLANAGSAQEPSIATLEPGGSWTVETNSGRCLVRREFGPVKKPLTLQIASEADGRRFDLILFGHGLPKSRDGVQVNLTFDPAARPISGIAEDGALRGGAKGALAFRDIPAEHLSAILSEQLVTIVAGTKYSATVRMAETRAATNLLDTCRDDLWKSWGMPREAGRQLRVAPRPAGGSGAGNPGIVFAQFAHVPTRPVATDAWFSWLDYPTEALRKEQSGTVVMVLEISATGTVSDCRVVLSSEAEALDKQSCALLVKRARYQPATDMTGNPVAATIIERIRWQIPSM